MKGQYYSNLLLCLQKDGKVEEYYIIIFKYLEYLWQKKKITAALNLLDKHQKESKKRPKLFLYRLKFAILQNDCAKVDELLLNLMIAERKINKWLQMDDLNKDTIFQDILLLLSAEYSDNINSVIVREFCIRCYLLNIKKIYSPFSEKSLKNQLEIITLIEKSLIFITENILLNPKYLPTYFLAAYLYYTFNQLNKARTNISFITEKKKLKEYQEFKRIEEDYVVLTDLLDRLDSDVGSDENFVSNFNIDELKIFKKELDTSFKRRQQQKLKSKKVSLMDDSIFPSSLSEEAWAKGQRSLYIKEQRSQEIVKRSESNFCKYFSLIEKDEYFEIYKDLVVAFNTLSMANVSEIILNKIEEDIGICVDVDGDVENREDKTNLVEILNFYYLRIHTMIEQKNYHEASALAEYIIKKHPLKEHEFLCFNYLHAELLAKIGKKKLAKDIYLKIFNINPTYRLVKERIKEFVENK
ncbi:MAG: hypothetical protein HQK49_10355 [Oligoflexia bacterium]|nr:hypothetical protein [Oligoflexia bacterium]